MNYILRQIGRKGHPLSIHETLEDARIAACDVVTKAFRRGERLTVEIEHAFTGKKHGGASTRNRT